MNEQLRQTVLDIFKTSEQQISDAVAMLERLFGGDNCAPAEQPAYTPPCDAEPGYEWAGKLEPARKGDRAYTPALGFFTAPFNWSDGVSRAHILRKLPAPNPEDQVPPATTTGEGAGLRAGQEVYIKAWVIDGKPDAVGDVKVAFDRLDHKASAESEWKDNVGTWAAASALRPAKGVGE